jgi:NAD(P)H-hydrate epimerase
MQVIDTIPKLKPRAIDAHKGDFGKVCIIAGSTGMSGAAALAGRAALRAGAGLVRVATPKSVLPIVASIEPSFTTIALPENSLGRISEKAINPVLEAAGQNDCLAFGPGLGISGALRSLLETLLEQDQLRLIIDADGLNNLASIKDWPTGLKASLILTPHPGEMKRLWSALPCDATPDDYQVALAAERVQRATTIELRHIRRRWAGLRSFVADRSPVIGMDPERAGFFWLAGQGGFGIMTSSSAARAAASLIADGALPPDLEALGLSPGALSPGRSGIHRR